MKKSLMSIITLFSLTAFADGSAGMSFFEMIFGNPNQRALSRNNKDGAVVGSEQCDGYGGIIGAVNSFFCHMEKDMGIVGPGAVTKLFTFPGGSIKVHAEIIKQPTTVNSVTYDYEGKVWLCRPSAADCSVTTNYSRMYYIAFSYDKTAGVNKGYALNAPNLIQGTTTDAMEIIYDLGSATASQTVQARTYFTDPSLKVYKMRAVGTKTSSSFKMNVAAHDGTNGFRFAMSGQPPSSGSSNYYNMYYEAAGAAGTGAASLDAVAIGTPAAAAGLCVTSSESGTTSAPAAVASSNCSGFSFASFDYNALTATGNPNVQGMTSASVLGTWNGMAANPSAL